MPIDYSGVGDSAWKMAAAMSGAVGSVTGKIEDHFEKQKTYKDELKTGKELAKAMKVIYPELSTAIDPYIAQMDDEETPLSSRAALGRDAGTLINAYIRKGESDRNYNLDLAQSNRANAADSRDAESHAANMDAVARAMKERDEFDLRQKQTDAFLAPERMKQLIQQTNKLEQDGYRPLISTSKLQEALNGASPEQQNDIFKAAMAGLPQPVQEQINYDTPATINGQPGKIATAYNPETGRMREIPIDAWGDGSGGQSLPGGGDLAASLPANLAPYAQTFVAAGQRHGIDPRFLAAISMHETANGTSSAFKSKNNAMGISDAKGPTPQESVEASIEAMARSLTRPGGHYDGKNTIGEIGATYAPKGAGNDPRGLNGYWPGKVGEYYAGLGGNPQGSVRIQAGAPTGPARTPEQVRKEQLEIAKMEADGKAADTAAQKANNKASRVLDVIDKYTFFDQASGERKPNERLGDAVGFGAGVGSYWNRAFDDRTAADQQELTRNLIESSLLEAAKDLKPVSEDEMKMLMERRPKITDGPAVWARFMTEAEQILKDGMTGEAKVAPTVSRAEELRRRKEAAEAAARR